MMSLVQQDLERRKVGVPLNQRWRWTKASERRGIERPDRLYDRGGVVVDQNVHVLGDVMAGKVDLADRLDWKCLEVGDRVEPEIPGADIDIVDIAEDPAAGSAGELGHELRLGDPRMPVAEVGGRVLAQQPSGERPLPPIHLVAKKTEAPLRVPPRQHVVS